MSNETAQKPESYQNLTTDSEQAASDFLVGALRHAYASISVCVDSGKYRIEVSTKQEPTKE